MILVISAVFLLFLAFSIILFIKIIKDKKKIKYRNVGIILTLFYIIFICFIVFYTINGIPYNSDVSKTEIEYSFDDYNKVIKIKTISEPEEITREYTQIADLYSITDTTQFYCVYFYNVFGKNISSKIITTEELKKYK